MKDKHREGKGTTEEKQRRSNGKVWEQYRKNIHVRTTLTKSIEKQKNNTGKNTGKAEETHRQDIGNTKGKHKKKQKKIKPEASDTTPEHIRKPKEQKRPNIRKATGSLAEHGTNIENKNEARRKSIGTHKEGRRKAKEKHRKSKRTTQDNHKTTSGEA